MSTNTQRLALQQVTRCADPLDTMHLRVEGLSSRLLQFLLQLSTSSPRERQNAAVQGMLQNDKNKTKSVVHWMEHFLSSKLTAGRL